MYFNGFLPRLHGEFPVLSNIILRIPGFVKNRNDPAKNPNSIPATKFGSLPEIDSKRKTAHRETAENAVPVKSVRPSEAPIQIWIVIHIRILHHVIHLFLLLNILHVPL